MGKIPRLVLGYIERHYMLDKNKEELQAERAHAHKQDLAHRLTDVRLRKPFAGSYTQMLVGHGIKGIRFPKLTKTQRRNKLMDLQFNDFQDKLRGMSNVA